jgi:hypothetical protein
LNPGFEGCVPDFDVHRTFLGSKVRERRYRSNNVRLGVGRV